MDRTLAEQAWGPEFDSPFITLPFSLRYQTEVRARMVPSVVSYLTSWLTDISLISSVGTLGERKLWGVFILMGANPFTGAPLS